MDEFEIFKELDQEIANTIDIKKEFIKNFKICGHAIDNEINDRITTYTFAKALNEYYSPVYNIEGYKLYSLICPKDEIHDILVYNSFIYGYFRYKIENNIIKFLYIWQDTMFVFKRLFFNYYFIRFNSILTSSLYDKWQLKHWSLLVEFFENCKLYSVTNNSKLEITKNEIINYNCDTKILIEKNMIKLKEILSNELNEYPMRDGYQFVIEK